MATILAVDDEPDILEFLKYVLGHAEHAVLTAPDGVRALDVLDGETMVDLLLTDVIMPGISGFNLARMAKLRRPSLPVLFLTGFYEQALTLGYPLTDYGRVMHKPCRARELVDEVKAALGGRGA